MIGDMLVPRKVRKSLAVLVTVIFILSQTLAGTALAVTNLHSTEITDTTVSLAWDNSAEETTGLYVSPMGAGIWSPTVSELVYNSVSAAVYGLLPNTSYDFKVTTTGSPSEAVVNNITTHSDTSADLSSGGGSQTPYGTLEINPVSGSPGQVQNLTLTYYPGDMLSNGTVEFLLPAGFSAASDDTYIGGAGTTPIGSGAISNVGRTVTITGLNTSVDPVILNLNNKTMPTAGGYMFSARADSDGPGAAYTYSPGTGAEARTFNVAQLPSPVWRFDNGEVPPADPGAFHPFDYNESTNSLTLYWEKVYDGESPVSAYKIYRAVDSDSDWEDPASWGTEILATSEPTTFTAPNGITFFAFSDDALLSETSPGTEYRFGIQAVNGSNTSGISNIPYPFLTPGGQTEGAAIDIQDSPAVTFELRDDQGVVPANGSIYASAPANPDVTGIRGTVNLSGQVTLKLRKGTSYIVGGGAPGMPSAAERKIYVDTGGSVFVDGVITPGGVVSLTMKKPDRIISGTIRYSDGSPVIGAPVVARSNKYPAGTPPAFTAADGSYSLFVPRDIWTVEVFVPEMGTIVVAGSADTKSNDSVTADLKLPALTSFAKVTGTVLKGGSPVQGAMVWAEDSSKEYLNGVVTGPDGRYTLQFDAGRAAGATIHCSSPQFGELAPQAYAATVNFSVSTGTLNITFGKAVTGTVSIFQPGASDRRIGGEMKNSGGISLKAPTGVYTVEVYINEIGRITRQKVDLPGALDLSAEVAQAGAISLNVAVTDGGGDAWVSVIGIEQGKTIAQGKRTAGGTATFTVPRNTEVSVSVRRDGFFPAKQDVRLGAADTTLNFTLVAEAIDHAVTVTLTGSGDATGKSEYYVWAKEILTGSVVKSRSTVPNGIVVKLPSAGSWVFKAGTEGYFSDEVTLPVSGAGTLSLPLSNAVATKTATAVVKSNQGGTVSSQNVGVKLVIPANALGSTDTNASITTSSTLAVTETSSVKPMGSARDITITGSEGRITTLSRSIEIILDYHSDYLTWPAGHRDQMALQMQLAYWDAGVDDWVIIPSVNDTVNHAIRGFVDHLTKFAVVYPQTLVIRGMAAAQPSQTTSSGPSPRGDEISAAALSEALENARNTGNLVLQAVSRDKLALTLEQFRSIEAAAKPVEIRMSDASLSFSPEVLKASGLDFGKVASFTLEARKAGEEEARGLAARSKNANLYSLKGSVFQLSVRVKMEDYSEQELKQFNGKISVSLPVPTESRSAAAKGGLYAGRFNEVTGSWDAVPGTYDAITGTYRFETDRFSRWGLVEKAAPQVRTFSDITDHWARKDIEHMATNGYISGMGGGLYSPDAGVTRAQFATMLVNVLKLDEIADMPFGDVRPGEWYYFSVGRAYAAGLVKGAGPNLFSPEDLITREQMAAMICNALKYKGLLAEVNDPEEVLNIFADQPSISGWARKSSAQAVKHGILRGKPWGGQIYFASADKATRAEAAVMLKNLVGQLK